MSVIQIVGEFLIIVFLGFCGYGVFLALAAGISGQNPFHKSEDMEADNNTLGAAEQQERLNYLYANWHNYSAKEAAQLEVMSNKHNARENKANEAIRNQQNYETAQSIGCGCLLTPVVIGVMVFGFWFSSKYPGFDDLRVLFGW